MVFWGVVLLFILGSNLGGVGPDRGLRGGGRRGFTAYAKYCKVLGREMTRRLLPGGPGPSPGPFPWPQGRSFSTIITISSRTPGCSLALASAASCAKKFALGPQQYLEELGKHTSLYLQKWQSRKRAAGEYMFEYADVVLLTWY
jgi:hypothetical protein